MKATLGSSSKSKDKLNVLIDYDDCGPFGTGHKARCDYFESESMAPRSISVYMICQWPIRHPFDRLLPETHNVDSASKR